MQQLLSVTNTTAALAAGALISISAVVTASPAKAGYVTCQNAGNFTFCNGTGADGQRINTTTTRVGGMTQTRIDNGGSSANCTTYDYGYTRSTSCY